MTHIATIRNFPHPLAVASFSLGAILALISASSGAFAQSSPAAEEVAAEENAPSCSDIMTPTQVANAAVSELLAARARGDIKTGRDQPALLKKYLKLVTFAPESPPEDPFDRAALGELYFLTFKPREADQLYAGLLDRSDLIARLAWQRAMQIRRAAFDRPEDVRDMIAQYREKFSHAEEDMFGVSQQVAALAAAHFDKGENDQAIDMIAQAIRLTPPTGPYRAFTIHKRLEKPIKASGREGEIQALLRAKLDGLKERQREWERAAPSAQEELRRRAEAPEWYWRFQRVEPGVSLRAARKAQLNRLISDLSAYAGQ